MATGRGFALATTAITLPNLTSNSDANQVYWGYVESTQTAASGNTLGFAYSPVNTGNLLVSNELLGTNTSFAPTATDSPTGNNTSSAVIFAAVLVQALVGLWELWPLAVVALGGSTLLPRRSTRELRAA